MPNNLSDEFLLASQVSRVHKNSSPDINNIGSDFGVTKRFVMSELRFEWWYLKVDLTVVWKDRRSDAFVFRELT